MDKLTSMLNDLKVKDLMQKDVITITSDSPAGDAAKIMLKNRVHGLPVVNADRPDEIVSMITSFDLLGLTYYGRFSEDTDYIRTTRVAELIKDQSLVSINPETTLEDALDLMAEHGIRTLPVVENGKLAGLISVIDILKKISGK